MSEQARDQAPVTDEQMEAINRLTRRKLRPEEVYVFSLLLCDNEVDRDHDRFDDAALEKLGELFQGKTGVFDHIPRAQNQSARIFATQVVEDGSVEHSLGLPYRALKAWAYMVRSPKSEELILEIDGGIKKEVSVGCAVERITCSVCGADRQQEQCGHQKGRTYDGVLCHHLLQQPTDAYEWSFVAVPAQKKAGVVKVHRPGGSAEPKSTPFPTLEKYLGEDKLPEQDRQVLGREYRRMKGLALAGERYLEELRREVVKYLLMSRPELDPAVTEEVAAGMDLTQLDAFRRGFRGEFQGRYPAPQLAGGPREEKDSGYEQFKL